MATITKQDFDNMSWDELMAFEAERSQPLSLSDDQVKLFDYRTILYHMDQYNYKLPLLAEKDSAVSFISNTLSHMAADGYLRIGNTAYEMTEKGSSELENMGEQYHSMVEHYDVFAFVDLHDSGFLEDGDDPEDTVLVNGEEFPRFIDLRVAIMRFKGISPFDMVFLTLLKEHRIADKPEWEFDMALGKELYNEVEEIVNSAYTLQDLTNMKKTNDNGEIPGSDILKDVLAAGNDINKKRKAAERKQPTAPVRSNGHEVVETVVTEEVVVYEPFHSYAYVSYDYYDYYYDPFYVEPCWVIYW